ncbi:right-handed parallel beta-helix repeat-containing protein [Massilia sp. W12]|uniref:right-handed parallel beta-helix repeat-containing protein n=1 Tax=Massilia sp. W12 TaxID=3126507 RepID=UPI0030CD226F
MKSHFPLILAASILAPLAVTQAHATALYLAPDGIDSNSCGAYASPCKTVKRALRTSSGVDRLRQGDQIYFKQGVYTINYANRNDYSINDFAPPLESCATPTQSNALLLGLDPAATADAVLEMAEDFEDPAVNRNFFGTLMSISKSNCVILDGANGAKKRIILDGKERKFGGLDNPYYLAHEGGPIPDDDDPMPSDASLLQVKHDIPANEPPSALSYGGVVIKNMEVRNTRGRGIRVSLYKNVEISNNIVRNVNYRAIGGFGENVRILNNHVSDAAKINRNNIVFYAKQRSGGWPGVVQMGGDWTFHSIFPRSKNIVISGNLVEKSWGEGIMCSCDEAQIRGNTVRDTYSVGIYLHQLSKALVEQNYIYTTTAWYHRPLQRTPVIPPSPVPDNLRRPMNGFTLASEQSVHGSIRLSDIQVRNNLIHTTAFGINYWYDSNNPGPDNTYEKINISHNTILNSQSSHAIYIDTLPPTSMRSPDNLIANNLIERTASGQDIRVTDTDLWLISGNYMINRGDYSIFARLDADRSLHAGSPPYLFRPATGHPVRNYPTQSTFTTGVLKDWDLQSRIPFKPIPGIFE